MRHCRSLIRSHQVVEIMTACDKQWRDAAEIRLHLIAYGRTPRCIEMEWRFSCLQGLNAMVVAMVLISFSTTAQGIHSGSPPQRKQSSASIHRLRQSQNTPRSAPYYDSAQSFSAASFRSIA